VSNFWKIVAIVFAVYFVASNPDGTAAIAKKVGGAVMAAADGLGQAISAVFS
jgi:hypothetical protein